MKKLLFIIVAVSFSLSLHAQNWFEIDLGTDLRLNAVDFPSDQIGYIAGDSSRLFKSTDGGFSWDTIQHSGLVTNALQSINEIQFLTNDLGFAVTNGSNGGVFKTTDGGLTWIQMPAPASNGFCFFESVYMFDENNGFIGGNGCFSGSLIDKLESNVFSTTNVDAMNGVYESLVDFDFKDSNVGLAATKSKYIYRTTDGGSTWDTIPTDLTIGKVNGIRFARGDTCYASFDNQTNAFGILKSVDGGLTWVQDGSSATFAYPEYHCVAATQQGKIYVGAESSGWTQPLIFSSDYNGQWTYDDVDQVIYDIDSYGNDITFGVGDSGLVVVNVDPSTLSLDEMEIIDVVEVSAYPNPAKDILNIKTTHPVHLIQLINITGQVVFAKTSYGQLNHFLQVTDIDSGIYLLKIYSGSTVQTKKVQIRN
jgi:photosystem II stability/assembly factor-like uncharacterized protein